MAIPSRLEKKDMIYLGFDKVDELFSWRDNGHKDHVRNFTPILEDVVIKLSDDYFIHVEPENELDGYTQRFTVHSRDVILAIIHWNRHTMIGNLSEDNIPFAKETPDHKDFVQSTISMYTTLMAYMEHNKEVVTEKRVTTKRPKSRKRKKGRGSKYTYLKRRVYALPKEIKDYEGISIGDKKRAYTKPTEPFIVRGHWRTYKSGKRVWVPAYSKYRPEKEGKDKEVKPKKYKFN